VTKLKQFTGLLVLVVGLAVLANAGVFSGNGKTKDRNCGPGVRAQAVVASALWAAKTGQKRSFVQIHGHIGPTDISEPNTSVSPQRFPAQACPGETALIVAEAHNGPLPVLQCMLTVGGDLLTGDAVTKTGTPGYRAQCQAVIP
jgi:hypothetical protein